MKIPTPDEDLDEIMSRAAGRRFIRSILRTALDSDGFSSDPLTLAYNAGVRQAGRELDARAKDVCPRKWMLMMQEDIAMDDDVSKEQTHVEP